MTAITPDRMDALTQHDAVCGDCYRPIVFSQRADGAGWWRHDSRAVDHEVITIVERDAIDEQDIQPVCRFCLADVPRSEAYVVSVEKVVLFDGQGGADAYAAPYWYACGDCAVLTMVNDFDGLFERATVARCSGISPEAQERARDAAGPIVLAFQRTDKGFGMAAKHFDGSTPWASK